MMLRLRNRCRPVDQHAFNRRRVLQGLVAAALPLSTLSCGKGSGGHRQGRAVGGGRTAGNLQSHASGGLCLQGPEQRRPRRRPAALRIPVQQVQRLARGQGILDGGPHSGGLHACAAGHGPGGQEGTGKNRLARASLRRRHHGQERFAVPDLQATGGQADRDSQPLRRGLSVPEKDAGAGEYDARATSKSWRWRHPTCRRRFTRTPSMPIAPANPSAPPLSKPVTRGRCA